MKVFLAGATGAIGRSLLPQLVAGGHTVTGTIRTPDTINSIRRFGANADVINALREEEVFEADGRAVPDVIIHQLTAIPTVFNLKRFDEEFALTNKLRTEGTDFLLAAARS